LARATASPWAHAVVSRLPLFPSGDMQAQAHLRGGLPFTVPLPAVAPPAAAAAAAALARPSSLAAPAVTASPVQAPRWWRRQRPSGARPRRLTAATACAAAAATATATGKAQALKQLRKKRAKPTEAAEALVELRQDGGLEDAKSYSTAITACSNGDKWELAVSLVDEMCSQDLRPTAACLGAAEEACRRGSAEEHAARLASLRDGGGAPAAPKQAAKKASAVKKAPAAAAAASEGGERVKYARGGLTTRLRWRLADDDYIEKWVNILREDGWFANDTKDGLKGYTQAMKSLDHGGHWQWVIHLLDEVRSGQPDTKSEFAQLAHTIAINACGRAENWQHALLVMEEMPQRKFHPDFETYQSAAFACKRSGKWQEALALIMRAQDEKKGNKESYSIAMSACADGEAWQAAIALLDGANDSPFDEVSKDMPFYGIAILAAGRAGKWEHCLAMLQEMLDNQLELDDRAFACTIQAINEAVRNSPHARRLKEEMKRRKLTLPEWVKDPLRQEEHMLDTPEMRFPMPLASLIPYARKEVYLLKWVQEKSTPGDIDSVIEAIEQFAVERRWLKVQGDEKKVLLEKTLRPTDRIVEFGCYVGYSSLCMAKRMRDLGGQGSVTSVDVNASTAYIARAVHQWAGAEGMAQIRVGCAADWLATKHLGTIDFLLLDHRGTIYHDDLYSAEPYLSPTARVFADNVLYPGAPLFLNYIDVQGYKIKIVELKEFLRPDLDDWVVIAEPPPPEKRKPKPTSHPPELRRLSAEVDAISWRSQNQEVDWVGFQQRVNPIFFKWKKDRGL